MGVGWGKELVPEGEAGTLSRAGGGVGPGGDNRHPAQRLSRRVEVGESAARAWAAAALSFHRRCPPPPPVSVPHLALLLAPCSLSTSGASDPISGHLNWPEDLPPDRPSGAALCSQVLPQHSPADWESCPGQGHRDSALVWGNWPLGRLQAHLLCPAKTMEP